MGKKGRPEFGTPKWISNNMKSKGLQKLRWYCQMCQKQCRDANGFKCHTMSESHQRQLLLFGDNPGKYLHSYSRDFEKAFNDILRRQYNEKRVHANVVYQQYISDKQHVHMNSTCWVTLTSFVRHLGRTGKAIIDETEKGWYITWCLKDPETEAREKRAAKKEKMAKDDEERIKEYIDAQIEKAKEQAKNDREFMATELLKSEDENLILDMKVKEVKRVKTEAEAEFKNAFKKPKLEPDNKSRKKEEKKRRIVALEEIMEEEKKQKRWKEKNDPHMVNAWITPNIIVKIITKSLGDKYYKKKGRIMEVIEDFAAVVVLNESGAKLKLDQEHLETVIPSVGREVTVLWGKHGGKDAVLENVDTKTFSAKLLLSSGDTISLPYEQFSKKFSDEVVFVPDRKRIDVISID